MASNISNAPYDAEKIENLYQRILRGQETGQKQDYEIKVDDFKAVPRNSDPALFNSYESFISPETKTVTIIMYRGGTTSADKFFFHLNGNSSSNNTLNGLPQVQSPESWRQDQLKQLEAEFTIKGLNDKIAKLTEEKQELQEEIDDLETECQRLKDGGNIAVGQIVGLLGEKLVSIVNPSKAQTLQGSPEQEATCKRKNEERDEEEVIPEGEKIEISEADAGYFKLLCDLKNRFAGEELESLMRLLDKLRNNQHALYSTHKHVDNFLKQKPKQDEKI